MGYPHRRSHQLIVGEPAAVPGAALVLQRPPRPPHERPGPAEPEGRAGTGGAHGRGVGGGPLLGRRKRLPKLRGDGLDLALELLQVGAAPALGLDEPPQRARELRELFGAAAAAVAAALAGRRRGRRPRSAAEGPEGLVEAFQDGRGTRVERAPHRALHIRAVGPLLLILGGRCGDGSSGSRG